MPAKPEFHPAAELEFEAAANWYEDRRTGFGDIFQDVVEAKIQQILQQPLSAPISISGTRQATMERFPYSVIYRLVDDEIQIIAIAHASRKPGYWKKRKLES